MERNKRQCCAIIAPAGCGLAKHDKNNYIAVRKGKGVNAMSKQRFRRLVHYVCELCEDPSKLGATKLNKILWYTDTFAYRLLGKSISGETAYVKRQFGPVPKSILKTLRELEADGSIVVREREYFGRPKREYIVLKAAKPEWFSDEEQEIVRSVVETVCNDHTAGSISDLSHDLIWEAAELGEDIPVNAVLAAKAAPLTKDDQKWADEAIKKHQRSIAAA